MDNVEDTDEGEGSGDEEDEEEDPIYSHPLVHLDMGLIEACTQIVSKAMLPSWTAEGWAELLGYVDFHYAAGDDETVIAKRPDTLATRGTSGLIDVEIEGWCNILGTYGMGGPGFFGLLLPPHIGTVVAYREYLVFAAWGADERILLDGRVLATHSRYRDQYGPWLTGGDEGRAALDALLLGARIDAAEVANDYMHLTISHGGRSHVLEYVKNDARLPPMGGGGPRTPAYEEGTIADYLVFQPENAVLWV